jgi:hypothetical protein
MEAIPEGTRLPVFRPSVLQRQSVITFVVVSCGGESGRYLSRLAYRLVTETI